MVEKYFAYYESPIGILEIAGTENGVQAVSFMEEKTALVAKISPCLRECWRQLDEYFRGKRREFSLKLDLLGTEFQKKVWHQLIKIPFGKTVSYGDIARAIGNVKAVRAVGNANGKNPISIIVPCHRVIGSKGDMVGFGGGIWRKKWLLRHEMDTFSKEHGRAVIAGNEVTKQSHKREKGGKGANNANYT